MLMHTLRPVDMLYGVLILHVSTSLLYAAHLWSPAQMCLQCVLSERALGLGREGCKAP